MCECGGVGDACICEDLDRVLADAPSAPTDGDDEIAEWLMGTIRQSNPD